MASASVLLSPSADSETQNLIASLTEAIHSGNAQLAKDLVAEVSNCHLKLDINISKDQSCQQNIGKEFMVNVHVEDRETSGIRFEFAVRSSDTVAALKAKVWNLYKVPADVQRWIIGKKIPDDSVTLGKCGVSGPGHTLFLYVVTARPACLARSQESENKGGPYGNDHQELPMLSPNIMSNNLSFDGHGKDFNSLLMNSNVHGNAQGNQANKPLYGIHAKGQIPPPPIPPRIPIQDDDDSDCDLNQTKVIMLNPLMQVIPTPSSNLPLSQKESNTNAKLPPGWECPTCTYFNLPTRPGCEMCSTDRPVSYVVPDNYQMTDREVALIIQQDEQERLTRQDHEVALRNNFQQWLKLDDIDLIENTETFQCPICFDDFQPGEGIILRDCLHQFCKECLQGAVTHNEEPTLTCPYQDDDGTCESVLQEREIRAIVPEDVFIKYLQRGLDQAESQAANSFHCKTTDCKGWCLYEDEVNFFVCPICRKENCLTCKVIHEGMNCKEYQVDLAAKAMNDEAARKTRDWIQEMVNDGSAMNCPQCKIVLQKKDGCDWIKCSVCKTEICWVTKGPRWGPKGSGDVSGGCRCGVNDKRCHPMCGNCH